MNYRNFGMALAAALLLFTSIPAMAAEETEAPVYGQSLMTAEERLQHQERIRNAETDEARNRIRAEHREQMQARAKERGVDLPDVAASGPAQPTRGRDLMTEEERAQHRAEMRSKQTDAERTQARKEHHEQMKERAEEKGATIPAEPPAGRGPGKGAGGGGGRR